MPFVNIKTTAKIDDALKQELTDQFRQIIHDELNKDLKWIMTSFEPEASLEFMESTENIAALDIRMLGVPTREQTEAMTKRFCAVVNEKLGIPKDRIYLLFYPTDLWGWDDIIF
jgi:phenylpyruvate tautomerase PptA (4-oxalocrotonate tautomerase family)